MVDILITSNDTIDSDVAAATVVRDRWMGILTKFRQSGAGRVRIGTKWETQEEAERRMLEVVHHQARTIALIEGFRSAFKADDRR